MKSFVWAAALFWLAAIVHAAEDSPDNPVYDHLVRDGIPINDQAVKLPEPSLSPEADEAAQNEVIHRVAEKKYKYDDFVRKSAVAPFMLQIDTAGDATEGDRVQRIDVWFVAYGKLKDITDEDLLGQLVGGGSTSEKGESESLTDDELRERDLKVDSTDARNESYFRIDSPLLDKVQISGIGHGVTTRAPNGVLAASLLDPRFADDSKYPNRWKPLERASSGKKSLGKSQPYAGFGGYCQVVTLSKPAGALFIECHMAINEPHDWFNGTNLLRSKLPVLMQDNVRTLRRKLAK
ncbi:MAG TPA: hypothetical protein VHC22_06700 [Pirellulales bacterium]|nr:hypothetical protein [Pirellulales bacterium]